MTIPAELLAQLPATSGDDVAIALLSNSPFDRRTLEFPAQLSDGSVLGNNRITSAVGQDKVVDLRVRINDDCPADGCRISLSGGAGPESEDGIEAVGKVDLYAFQDSLSQSAAANC